MRLSPLEEGIFKERAFLFTRIFEVIKNVYSKAEPKSINQQGLALQKALLRFSHGGGRLAGPFYPAEHRCQIHSNERDVQHKLAPFATASM